jgi:hypothetical protein|tara:strand:+ start:1618 stop:1761 length:144 start_codon:yes stop_codon:yes gene_type:complete
MRTILEFLVIGFLFLVGTSIISTVQLIGWLWTKLIEAKDYVLKISKH